MIMSICNNGDILKALMYFKLVINIIRIVVPIILIISISITLLRVINDKDNDALNKSLKGIVAKSVAAILVFMIPMFVNIIANIAGNDQSYLSCIEMATRDNVNAAYRLQALPLIDKARETLSSADYAAAKRAINKITDKEVKAKLIKELDSVAVYISINNEIEELAMNYDVKKYKALKAKIEAIEDDEIREKLLQTLKDKVGKKGSLSEFITDPNDPLYRNLKFLNGMTIKTVLEMNGSSVEKLNQQIKENVELFGIGTREAPVAAALTLIQTLAEYGYRINYYWGGKHSRVGIRENWGARTSAIGCDTFPGGKEACQASQIFLGLDCSGFVNWSLVQGFDNPSNKTQVTRIIGNESSARNGECGVGDVMVNGGHIVIIVDIDMANKRYIVAESANGVGLSYYPFNRGYVCRKLDYSN